MDKARRPSRHTPFTKSVTSKVISTLRDRIQSGLYENGARLPSERALEQDLNVDRRTVRAAIDELKTEGFLHQRPNCRPVVAVSSGQTKKHSGVLEFSNLSASRLVALIMWQGGASDRLGTVQQQIFWGMTETLAAAYYHAVFLDAGMNTTSDLPSFERESSCLNYALSCGFGGIVFFPQAYNHNRELMQRISQQVPLVFLDRMIPGVQGDVVSVENRQSMYDATWHLIEQGHKRIALVTTGEYINTVEDRVRGYLQAVHKAFPLTAYEMVLTPPFTESCLWPALDAVVGLPKHERPTAFVCVNNNVAMRVARHLAEHNFGVPEDVSIIGFDSVQQTLPNGVGLSAVEQPFEDIGREAAKLMLRRMHNPLEKFVHIELQGKLVLKESVTRIVSRHTVR